MIIAFIPTLLYSQKITDESVFNRELPFVSFLSPEEWSFYKYVSNPIGLYNGTPDVSIPLYTLKDGCIELPIVLRYNTSGIKIEEEASWVGLGWNLNFGGYVNRIVVEGFDDDDNSFDRYSSLFLKPSVYPEYRYKEIPIATVYDSIPYRSNAANASLWGKMAPDAYLFSYPGNSGCYVKDYRDDSIVVLRREQDIRIREYNAKHHNGKTIEIRSPEGVRHLFSYGADSRIQGNDRPNCISYPLSVTEYANGAQVKYHYNSYAYLKTVRTLYCSGTVKDNFGTARQYFKENDVKSSLSFLEQSTTQLRDIETPNYKIDFLTSARMDLDSVPKLDRRDTLQVNYYLDGPIVYYINGAGKDVRSLRGWRERRLMNLTKRILSREDPIWKENDDLYDEL